MDLFELEKQNSTVYPNVKRISPNRLVPYYLMSSYLYYELDKNVLSDGDYDYLCYRIALEWCVIKHRHKHLIDKQMLTNGTGFYIMDYPLITMSAAERWYSDYMKEKE